MTISRLFALITVALIAGIASARAQDTNPTFVVSYIEVAPSSARAAAGILRTLQDASRKEPGNTGFEVLQRKGQPQQFAILEAWKDAKAQAAHAAAANTAQLRDKLKPLLAAPIDERVHTGFVVGKAKVTGRGSVYVLTHVDLIGAKKDEGLAAIKQLSVDSAQDAGALRSVAAGQPAQSLDLGRGVARNSRPGKARSGRTHSQIPRGAPSNERQPV